MRAWRGMSRTAVAAALVLGAAAAARAGVVVETRTKEADSPGKATTGKIEIEGSRIRIDYAGDSGGGRPTTIVFDGTRHVLWVLDHQQKEVVRIDREVMDRLGGQVRAAQKEMKEQLERMPPEQRAMVEKMMRSAGMGAPRPTPPALEVKDTGRSDEVGGRSCRVYELRRGGKRKGEVCAVAWKEVGLERADFEAFRELGRFQEHWVDALGGESAPGQPYEIIEQVDGFPLRSRDVVDGEVVSETTFERIERRAVPAERFEIPAGYHSRAMDAPSH